MPGESPGHVLSLLSVDGSQERSHRRSWLCASHRGRTRVWRPVGEQWISGMPRPQPNLGAQITVEATAANQSLMCQVQSQSDL